MGIRRTLDVPAKGCSLYCEEWAATDLPADAPSLVMVRGLGFSSVLWHGLAERLCSDFRVVIFDHRFSVGPVA